MIRAIIGEAIFFFLPFILFFLFLALRSRNPTRWDEWEGKIGWLVIAGLACVIAGLVYFGMTREQHRGGYEPPRMENGRIVPGQFK